MAAADLIADLRARDIEVWLDDGRLRYSAAPGALTDALRDAVRQSKPEIVAYLAAQPAAAVVVAAPRVERGAPIPRAGAEAAPLSFAQQRLWFLDQLNPDSPAFNVPAAVRLRGRLNVPAVRRAAQEIARRHEVLRTRLPLRDGRPVQEVMALPPLVPVVDVSGLPAPESAMLRLARSEAHRPFDLSEGPMFRPCLIRLRPAADHALLLTMHHIVSDAWSVGICQRELGLLYRAFDTGRPSPLPPLPIQYRDFAAWQRARVDDEGLERQLAYWRQQLAQPALLDLPADGPRAATPDRPSGALAFALPASLSRQLVALGREEGATPFMTLLAAFAIVLGRYTGQTDVMVGAPIASRTQSSLEPLIGFFVNLLALRADLSGHPSLRALVRRMRDVTVAAYEHQDVPFERLVEALDLDRDPARHPLFQVVFTFNNTPRRDDDGEGGGVSLGGVDAEPFGGERPATAKYDIELSARETATGFKGHLEFAADVHDEARMASLLSAWRRVLEALARDPDQPLDELRWWDDASRAALVRSGEGPSCADAWVDVWARVGAQAAARPDAIALADGDEQLTYGQLVERVHALAARLPAIAGEARVGVHVPRGVAWVVCMLAVWARRGVYVPLDPAYPAARLAQLARGAAPAVVITDRGGDWPGAIVVSIAEDEGPGRGAAEPIADRPVAAESVVSESVATESGATETVAAKSGVAKSGVAKSGAAKTGATKIVATGTVATETVGVEPLSAALQPARLAYVIFTSGSTGLPKGAMVTHGGMINHLLAKVETLGLTTIDRLAQTAPASFDVSVWQVLAPLLSGGVVDIFDTETVADDVASVAAWTARGITVVETVPSQLVSLAAAQQAAATPVRGLRWMIANAEPLTRALCDAWSAAAAPGAGLINAYGPTECSDDVTQLVVTPGGAAGRWMPLGRPLRNTMLMVVDARRDLAPDGAVGEVWIGGAGVGRGYLGQPALTAARYVPDPFSATPGARAYRTGDRGRWRADGTLEFLGRIDHQVKVRGHRIEPGEIEARLVTHPGVSQCLVMPHERQPGDLQLVAYVVPAGQTEPSIPALRAYLAQQLPAFMIPTGWEWLPGLPISPNGKVDRRALPAPTWRGAMDEAVREGAWTAPATPLEEIIADIWASVLQIPAVGRDQSFFDIGGHSLLATQVMARLRQVCGVETPLRALFEAPTVAGLAAAVAAERRGERAAPPPLVPPPPRPDLLPLSFAQQRLWFLAQLEPESTAYHIATLVPLRGAVDMWALARAFEEVERRHEVCRTTFYVDGQTPAQRIAPPGPRALPLVDLAGLPRARAEAAVRRLIAEDEHRPFDVSRGPLWRTQVWRVDAETHVLAMTAHHILTDGWSMRILEREVRTLYAAFRAGQASPLAEPLLQYADYAVWQRGWLQGAAFDAQVAHWRERLAGAPAMTTLATGAERASMGRARGGRCELTLDPDLVSRVRALSRREGATLFMTLLAAFKTLVCRYTGQADLVIGSPIAHRTQAETEGLIGFFVNTQALRTDLSGDPSFAEVVRRVRATCLDAYACQDVPFERLVEELAPERDTGRTPLFQMMFTVDHAARGAAGEDAEAASNASPSHDAGPENAAAEGEGWGMRTRIAKFDLTFGLVERADDVLGALQYNSDLFDEETMARVARHFVSLLTAAVDRPSAPVSTLPLLSDTERRLLLETWNAPTFGPEADVQSDGNADANADANASVDTNASACGSADADANTRALHPTREIAASPTPAGFATSMTAAATAPTATTATTVAAVVARRALDRPDAPALVTATRSYSYAAIDRVATRLAHRLRAAGVRRETRVAIVLDLSPALLVAWLATMRAGGVIVPLDRRDPESRLAFLMRDAGCRVLIASSDGVAGSLPADGTPLRADAATGIVTVAVDDLIDDAGDTIGEATRSAETSAADSRGGDRDADGAGGVEVAGDTATPFADALPEQMAYVIYTSGSTGAPKGVMVTHGSLMNYLAWVDRRVLRGRPVAATTRPTFDACMKQLLAPLVAGRAVWMPVAQEDLALLPAAWTTTRGTIANVVPPLWDALLRQLEADPTHPGPSALLLGGEALPAALLARTWRRLPEVEIWNMYGPTETTANASASRCVPHRPVAIGRPVAHAQLYVLDRSMQPCPIGAAGELFVGGAAVARGYLQRPAQTADRFVPDPFGTTPGARLYRTGDRARWRSDAQVEYLGRLDGQVKLRGLRIEPGEIEAVLASHPTVRHCAVAVRERTPGDPRLVAFIVSSVTPLDAGALRAHAATQLPAALTPTTWVALEHLPLTRHGKLDRRALPTPEWSDEQTDASASLLPPRSAEEEIVAAIWADLLRRTTVGRTQNFFELGGHSLLATQVIARVRQACGVEVRLRALFETPTVEGLAAAIAQARRADGDSAPPPLTPQPRPAQVPLSFAQQRLWFLAQLEPESTAYHMTAAVRLTGGLDIAALRRSMAALVRRHEVLRTTFGVHDGAPTQEVHEADDWLALPVVDLAASAASVDIVAAGVSDAESVGKMPTRERVAARLAREQAERPFDLASGPLFRRTLIRLGADEHVLLLALHHIASDGWSMGILVRELSALYAAYRTGQEAALPPLPVQVADHALWQRGWLQGAALDRQIAYWRAQLHDLPELDLPRDLPAPARPTGAAASHEITLPAAAAAAVRALEREESVTLFMTLLASLQALLGVTAGQDTFAVGTVVAQRSHAETEGLIGFFANTLALRADVRGNPTFRTLLRRVRTMALDAYAHQDVPFEKLVETLTAAGDTTRGGRAPWVQTMLVLQNTPGGSASLGPVAIAPFAAAESSIRFELTALVDLLGDGALRATLQYARERFEPRTIARLASHWMALLTLAAEQPDARLSDLLARSAPEAPCDAPCDAAARGAVTAATVAAVAPTDLISVWAAQVTAHPDAIALVDDARQLTYAAVQREAGHLAAWLLDRGVRPGDRIGLYLPRTADVAIAMLGVLQARAIYVPLDPAHAASRTRDSLAGAGVRRVLVAGEGTPPPAIADGPWTIDSLAAIRTRFARVRLTARPRPSSAAYIIFTSGSTGRPKGVVVTHANITRLLTSTQPWFAFGPDDVWVMAHSPAFDFSVWEIWGALTTGGRLVLLDIDTVRSPEAVWARVEREQVTVLNQTPRAFDSLAVVACERAVRPGALRTVVFGGELLDVSRLRPWWARFGSAQPRLVNMYGITETTVHVTYRPVTEADLARPWRSPIGAAIPDLPVFVLGAGGERLGEGSVGEMHVGGAGVAMGYWGQPALTAERFRPDPFTGAPGARLYRSGDRARWRAAGELEYLGRADDQVKVRGYRVEPGEIEAVLSRHPDLRQCVVVTRERAPDDAQLVAYVVPSVSPASSSGSPIVGSHSFEPQSSGPRSSEPQSFESRAPGSASPASATMASASSVSTGAVTSAHAELTAAALRAFLQERLPDYMVPAAWVTLSELPLTPNGKIDRRALPPPRWGDVASEAAPLRTPLEELLAGIWADVLQVDQVGAHQSFFELGGHSLLATQVMARVRCACDVELPLRALFDGPTVHQLARDVERARTEIGSTTPPMLPLPPRPAAVPLSFAQQRLWFLAQLDPGSAAYNVPAAVALSGAVDVWAIARALEAIEARHEVLRTRLVVREEAPVQEVRPVSARTLPVVDLRSLPDAALDSAAHAITAAEAARPFDLASGEMWRTTLVRLPSEHLLIIVLHHIVTDGWSARILVRELTEAYGAYADDRVPAWSALPLQYADYAIWQRRWQTMDLLSAQRGYWHRQLAALPAPALTPRVAAVPADRTRATGASLPFSVDTDVVRRLDTMARQEGVTTFMLLLAAFQTLLARQTGSRDILVGTDVANRTQAETESLLGFFVNQLVLRTDLGGNPTFRTLLRRVRRVALDAYAHQDLPFEQVVEAVAPGSDREWPLFQAKLVLQNAGRAHTAREQAAVQARGVAVATTVAKAPLLVTLSAEGGAIDGDFAFDRRWFTEPQVRAWQRGFHDILRAAAADPTATIETLGALADAAAAQEQAVRREARTTARSRRWDDLAARPS